MTVCGIRFRSAIGRPVRNDPEEQKAEHTGLFRHSRTNLIQFGDFVRWLRSWRPVAILAGWRREGNFSRIIPSINQ